MDKQVGSNFYRDAIGKQKYGVYRGFDSNKTDADEKVDNMMKEMEKAVEKKMENDVEAQALISQIRKNNSVYVNTTGNYANSLMGTAEKFSAEYFKIHYNEYKYCYENIEQITADYKTRIEKLKTGIHFSKKARIEKLELELKTATDRARVYKERTEKQKGYEKTWLKDGKFVDVNEKLEKQYQQKEYQYMLDAARELIKKYPELATYDIFNMKTSYNRIAIEALKEAQVEFLCSKAGLPVVKTEKRFQRMYDYPFAEEYDREIKRHYDLACRMCDTLFERMQNNKEAQSLKGQIGISKEAEDRYNKIEYEYKKDIIREIIKEYPLHDYSEDIKRTLGLGEFVDALKEVQIELGIVSKTHSKVEQEQHFDSKEELVK